MEVLIINGTDYSSAIATKGYGWSRNDLDSDKTTRTKNGTMRRDKITTKRKLRYTTRSVKRDVLAKLDDDLNIGAISCRTPAQTATRSAGLPTSTRAGRIFSRSPVMSCACKTA